MNTPVRRAILILLVLMLPLQGAVAASRWICAASSHHGAAVVMDAEQMHSSMGHSHQGDLADDAPSEADAHGSGATTPHDAAGSCQLCAACSLTSATPPSPLALLSISPAYAGFLPVAVPRPHNVADGPERPPRTV